MNTRSPEYDKRMSEYRDRLLQRNRDMTTDDDDRIDEIIRRADEQYAAELARQEQQQVKAEQPEPEISDSYRMHANKLESVLKEVGVGGEKETERSKKPETVTKPQKTIFADADDDDESEDDAFESDAVYAKKRTGASKKNASGVQEKHDASMELAATDRRKENITRKPAPKLSEIYNKPEPEEERIQEEENGHAGKGIFGRIKQNIKSAMDQAAYEREFGYDDEEDDFDLEETKTKPAASSAKRAYGADHNREAKDGTRLSQTGTNRIEASNRQATPAGQTTGQRRTAQDGQTGQNPQRKTAQKGQAGQTSRQRRTTQDGQTGQNPQRKVAKAAQSGQNGQTSGQRRTAQGGQTGQAPQRKTAQRGQAGHLSQLVTEPQTMQYDETETASRSSGQMKPLSKLAKWGILAGIMAILFIVVTILYVTANARYKYNQMDIRQIDEKDLMVNEGVKELSKGYTTIALYGVDSRDAVLNEGTNSDAIIIVSINNETKDVKLVSVYRDTMFKIQNKTGVTNKVNYAYQLGGALMSINTLNVNLDLDITDYIAVDFNAMAEIVNAIGGVDIDIKEDEINNLNKNLAEQISLSGSYSDGIHEAGKQTLNGPQAVAYSRIRSTEQGDITRTERQRTVLMAMIDKLGKANAKTITNLIDVSFKCISTSFTKEEIQELVKDFDKYKMTANTGYPFAYSFVDSKEKGSMIVAADMSANVTGLHEYLYGTKGYEPSATVQKISREIGDETGVAAKKVNVPAKNQKPGDDGKDKNDKNENDKVDTITTPPEGMYENE